MYKEISFVLFTIYIIFFTYHTNTSLFNLLNNNISSLFRSS